MTAPVGRRRWLLALALLLAVGCTGDGAGEEPTLPDPPPVEDTAGPPSGRDVAVVLPAATELEVAVLDALADRLDGLASELPDAVRELHVLRPDGPAFVGDLLELAAARDAQLACVLGEGTESLGDTVARRHGRTTVCVLPAEPPLEQDDDAAPAAVRVPAPVFELGILVGTAARTAALSRRGPPGADDGEDEDAPGPVVVGLVLGGDELDADRFRAGLLEGLGEVEAIEAAAGDAEPAAAVAAVVAAGAEVVVLDGAAGAAAALAAVPDGVGVVLPVDLAPPTDPETDDGPELVLAYRLRWEQLLAEVVERAVEGTLAGWRASATDGYLDWSAMPGTSDLRPWEHDPGLEAALEAALGALATDTGLPPDTAPASGSTGDGDG
jgi:hypothetical protein